MEVEPVGRRRCRSSPSTVAAQVVHVAGVERLVEVADEVDQEDQRLGPRAGRRRSFRIFTSRSICAETQLPSLHAGFRSNGLQMLTF
jgi:hypothetical protein